MSGKRKPLNVTIDTGIVQAARDAGLNLSKVSEAGLIEAIRHENERRWHEENHAALDSSNRWVERNGLPFAKHRPF
ncbi:type II toxin-antitoxin system CcdA family antitoxin [Sphingomonas mucosissima]|nr:type II toxin-antitoxin system CcdA family antitoxin [Sphingomonas mucosissima]